MNHPTKIVVGLPTYKRPKMLQDCLASLLAMNRGRESNRLNVVLLVIDNNQSHHEVEEIVHSFSRQTQPGLTVTDCHQPVRGIAHARNCAIDYAKKEKADFIAYLDDDEVVSPDWIEALHQTISLSKADIVQAPVLYRYPKGTSSWFFQKQKRSPEELTPISTVATGNVIFGTQLVTKMGLSFDGSYTTCAGEDNDFFERALQKGAVALRTNKAPVFENTPYEKTFLSYQMKRHFSCGAANAKRWRSLYTIWHALRRALPKALGRFISGWVILLLNTLIWRKRGIVKGLHYLSFSCGLASGLMGKNIDLYEKVLGS